MSCPVASSHALDEFEIALVDSSRERPDVPERKNPVGPVDDCPVDTRTSENLPMVTTVTDNGGPFRSFRFEAFIAAHKELHHVRTKVRTPGQNGAYERGFGTLKYERLFID